MGLLLMVRHGQGSFGTGDYDRLSELGVRQSQVVGERLRPQAPSVRRVISGGLLRQRQTAEHLMAGAGLSPDLLEIDPRWDEYDGGALIAAHLPPDSAEQAAAQSDRRVFQSLLDQGTVRWTSGEHDDDYPESWPAFTARVSDALDDALSGSGTTLVVASGGTIAWACARVLDLHPAGWASFVRTMANTGLSKIISGRSGTNLVTFNDHAHVENDPTLLTYR